MFIHCNKNGITINPTKKKSQQNQMVFNLKCSLRYTFASTPDLHGIYSICKWSLILQRNTVKVILLKTFKSVQTLLIIEHNLSIKHCIIIAMNSTIISRYNYFICFQDPYDVLQMCHYSAVNSQHEAVAPCSHVDEILTNQCIIICWLKSKGK